MFLNDAGGRSVLCPLLVPDATTRFTKFPSPTPAHVAMPDLPPVHWEHVEDTGLWTDECSYHNFCFENLQCRHSVPLCSAITPTGQRRGIQIHGKDGFGAMAMGAKLRRSCGLNILFVFQSTMEQWTCSKDLLDSREGQFPVDPSRHFWPGSRGSGPGSGPDPGPGLLSRVDWCTVNCTPCLVPLFTLFTVGCFTVPNLYNMILLFWFIMRNQTWTLISPANLGFWMCCFVAPADTTRLSTLNGFGHWQTDQNGQKREKSNWAAIVWALHQLSEWNFWTINIFLSETTSASVPPPVAGDCQQKLLGSSCCRVTVCSTVPLFHCSTVPLFHCSDCCRSCCNISGVWTPHGFFQRLTSKLLAPKLLAPTFHLLQSLTSLLVPRFDDYIYIYIYHISNVLSKEFSHVFFEISSITLTWGGVLLQYFLMCNKSLTGAKQIWNFRFLNLWFCFFVAKISGKSKIKFPEANGGT